MYNRCIYNCSLDNNGIKCKRQLIWPAADSETNNVKKVM